MDSLSPNSERHYKKIIIPDGSIRPNETVIIEVPAEFQKNRTFLSTRGNLNETFSATGLTNVTDVLNQTRSKNAIPNATFNDPHRTINRSDPGKTYAQDSCKPHELTNQNLTRKSEHLLFNVCRYYHTYYVLVDEVPEMFKRLVYNSSRHCNEINSNNFDSQSVHTTIDGSNQFHESYASHASFSRPKPECETNEHVPKKRKESTSLQWHRWKLCKPPTAISIDQPKPCCSNKSCRVNNVGSNATEIGDQQKNHKIVDQPFASKNPDDMLSKLSLVNYLLTDAKLDQDKSNASNYENSSNESFVTLLNETIKTFTGDSNFQSLLNATPSDSIRNLKNIIDNVSKSLNNSSKDKSNYRSLLNETPVQTIENKSHSRTSQDKSNYQSLLDKTPNRTCESRQTVSTFEELSNLNLLFDTIAQLENKLKQIKDSLLKQLNTVVLKAVPIILTDNVLTTESLSSFVHSMH